MEQELETAEKRAERGEQYGHFLTTHTHSGLNSLCVYVLLSPVFSLLFPLLSPVSSFISSPCVLQEGEDPSGAAPGSGPVSENSAGLSRQSTVYNLFITSVSDP